MVGLCYEGLPWFTGAAVLSQGLPSFQVCTVALLHEFSARGIMTLNDFIALEGDCLHGVWSLPVTLRPELSARVACTVMGLAQALVIVFLSIRGRPIHDILVSLLLFWQIRAMGTLLSDPKGNASWYTATGIAIYVSGMMITAFAIRSLEV